MTVSPDSIAKVRQRRDRPIRRPSGSPGLSSFPSQNRAPTIIVVGDGRAPTASRIDYLRDRAFRVITTPMATLTVTVPPAPLIYLIEGVTQFRRHQAFRVGLQPLARSHTIVIDQAGEDDLTIELLDLGADDVVAWNCHDRELLSRIKAVLGLNRRPGPPPFATTVYGLGALGELAPHDMTLHLANGAIVRLSRSECDLLECLARSPRTMVSRDQILASLSERDADVFDRTIDLRISRLRKRLAHHGGLEIIQTCRGAGYRLNVDVRRYRS